MHADEMRLAFAVISARVPKTETIQILTDNANGISLHLIEYERRRMRGGSGASTRDKMRCGAHRGAVRLSGAHCSGDARFFQRVHNAAAAVAAAGAAAAMTAAC